MAVNWEYYEDARFEEMNDLYLPASGQGETMATQAVTAVNKLIFKWYNDGDVYDNTYHLEGWCNDLSSYANWLHKHISEASEVLESIVDCETEGEYEDLLKDLSDIVIDYEFLHELNKIPAVDSIYKCDGVFVWEDALDESDDSYEYEHFYY